MNKKKRIRGLERELDGLGDCVAEWHLQLLSDIAVLSRRVEEMEQARRVNVTVTPEVDWGGEDITAFGDATATVNRALRQ